MRFGRKKLFTAVSFISVFLLLNASVDAVEKPVDDTYDVVVYGGTSGGIIAAIQVKRMGKSVVLIEPSKHIGGLTAGGLGATDIGNKAAVGGLSRTFYERIGDHYRNEENWKYEKSTDYNSRRQKKGDRAYWTFEPHVAEQLYHEMLHEADVPLVMQERLNLKTGVKKEGTGIVSITMESGRTFCGKMFIDATYEGDLLAKAGVSYHVGREAESKYGETVNGVRVKGAVHHQFNRAVDPYVIPGDPSSGLLPLIQTEGPGEEGAGDHRVQAYCFRMCTTDAPENRRAWTKPDGYDVKMFELVLRNCEAGDTRVPWAPVFMPNRKTDTNNNFAVSTDYLGANYDYPDGDYVTRERIIKAHELYQKGLMYTLATNPRVQESIRRNIQRLGLAKDEFVDNDNWPHQLYIREARRMVSEYVMTQKDCDGEREADDPVGLGAYNMDSHNTQRYAKDGRVYNEGDIQLGVSPYPISYRSIRPKASECTNLLVPVCLSASHMAFGSIRMEPVFMVLGQSAATAACHAIDEGVTVQKIDISKLVSRLSADKQMLKWDGPRRKLRLRIARMKGIVLDNSDAELTGEWKASSSFGGFVEQGYLHDSNEGKGKRHAIFRPTIEQSGQYEVRLYYIASSNRASNVPVTIRSADGSSQLTINQKKRANDNDFISLGTFRFDVGKAATIKISNTNTNGHVIVDAVQLMKAP
jgi:FAD dependent oxidoreductase